MARCGCGGDTCTCLVTAGPGVSVGGNGSAANPYVISATPVPLVTADTPCITLDGTGTSASPLTAAPRLDPAPGNLIVCGPNGLMVTGGTGGTVATGCGITGNGATGTPVTANTQAWPYPCDITSRAGGVYCAPDGELRSEPRPVVSGVGAANNTSFPNTAVPAGVDVPVTTASITLNNPDPCRPAFALVNVYGDVDFTLPPGAEAGWGLDTDDMMRVRNSGTSTSTAQHTQTTKPFTATIPAGGSTVFNVDITMGFGSGGATYTRVQWGIIALIVSN